MHRIPLTFQIAGIPFKVVKDEKLAEKTQRLGQVDYHQQQIAIDPKHAPLETTEQAYFHELVHTILFIMNEDKLQSDERFVDLFAQLLYQALASSTYPKEFHERIECLLSKNIDCAHRVFAEEKE